jgi:hypothetical protein
MQGASDPDFDTAVLKFPAIAFKGGTVELHMSDLSLHRCTKAALKNGWFKGLKIVGADGHLFSVTGAMLVRQTAQKAFPGLFAARLIEVALHLAGSRQLDVSEVRDIVLRLLNQNRGFWESGGKHLKVTLDSLARTTSIEAIWDVLLPLLTASPD